MSAASTFGMIVICENPRGRFREGNLKAATTATPGMNVKHESTDVYSPGMTGEFNIVKEASLIGMTVSDVYPAAGRFYSYSPLPGDDFLALGLSGETLNIGTRATFNAAGKLIASVTGQIVVEEAGGTLGADTLLRVRLGHTAAASV